MLISLRSRTRLDLKADYKYYSFGEGTPIGPTLPRSFRGNIYISQFVCFLAFPCERRSCPPYINKDTTMLKHITHAGAIGLLVFFASVTSRAQTPELIPTRRSVRCAMALTGSATHLPVRP